MVFTKAPELKEAFLGFLVETYQEDGTISAEVVEEITTWFKEHTKTEKKTKRKEEKDPNRVKKPIPASWLFRDKNRQQIIKDHFEGETVKGSVISQKAKELWLKMTEEEKEPYEKETQEKWVLYRDANPSSSASPSTPKKEFNFNKDEEREVPEDWNGPFDEKFLHKYACGYKAGVGRFETFEEAITAANGLEKCGGITMNMGKRSGYTLRVSNDPMTPTVKDEMGPFMSWTKKGFTPQVAEKKKKKSKKVTKDEEVEPTVEDKVEPTVEDKVEDSSDDEDEDGENMPELITSNKIQTDNSNVNTDGEQEEDSDSDSEEEDGLQVVQWEFDGTKYLVDEGNDELYDFDTQEPLGKKRKSKKNGGGFKIKNNK